MGSVGRSRDARYVGANEGVFEFENSRILRDHYNSVNRTINCDVANGNKSLQYCQRQQTAIEYLEKNHVDKETTIMIGDTLHDDEIANILGISSFLVAKGNQSKERLLKSNAIVLDDIKEILNYVY